MQRDYWRGYYGELIRLDAKKCRVGTACGNACIPKGDQCRQGLSLAIKQRLKALLNRALDKVDRGLGKVVDKIERIEAEKAAKEKAEADQRRLAREQEMLKASPFKSLAQLRAVRAYSGDDYEPMNSCARGQALPRGGDCGPYNRLADTFEEALQLLPQNTAGDPYYRGIAAQGALGRMFASLQEGDTFADPGFSSFSRDRWTADQFTDMTFQSDDDLQVTLITRSRKLANISQFSLISEEEEAVLPRGHSHRVRKVTREGRRLIIELDDADS